MTDNLDWFWQTDRVIAVLHISGGRGGAIHQLISFSPEVPKKKSVDVQNGAAHANQEGIGYTDPLDPDSHFHMHEKWQGQGAGSWPRSVLSGKDHDAMKRDISMLCTRYGEPITDVVARGGVLAYRSYPSLEEGSLIWPNRRVVAVYHRSIGISLREWYEKGLDVSIAPWQAAHLESMGMSLDQDRATVLDYYTLCHGGHDADRTGHKRYLRSCLPIMERNQERMLNGTNVYAIDVDEFFRDDWIGGYDQLCAHCGITPNYELASEFMHKYLTTQWRRDEA